VNLRNQRNVVPITVEQGAAKVRIQWLIDESTGAPRFSLRRFEIAPGGHTPLHEHPWEHEVYILSGKGSVIAGDAEAALEPDDAILLDPHEVHQFRASAGEMLVLLCIVPNGPASLH
jgi:quercetin dioxygenase-like cupin family protein